VHGFVDIAATFKASSKSASAVASARRDRAIVQLNEKA
jgi:hypothetical protein